MSLELNLLDFSRELGLPDCRLNHNGEWLAALANQQYLGVQERDEAVLVFILHPLGYGGLDVRARPQAGASVSSARRHRAAARARPSALAGRAEPHSAR